MHNTARTDALVLNLRFVKDSFFIARKIQKSAGSSVVGPLLKLSVLATALGMALVVLSITSGKGLQRAISRQFTQIEGDFTVSAYSMNRTQEVRPILLSDSLLSSLESAPYVAKVYPELHKLALLAAPENEQFAGVVLRGMGKEQFDHFFSHYRLIQPSEPGGRVPLERYGCFISSELARQLSLNTGDTAVITIMREGREMPTLRRSLVEGVYETSLQEFDQQHILMRSEDVRRLHRWQGDSVSTYTVYLKEAEGRQIIADYWNALVPYDITVQSIEARHPAIFGWLELFDTNIVLVLSIVLVVALANLVIALLVLIIDRTQMIGTLKALGAENRGILRIFQWLILQILGKGLLWGNAIGLLFSFLQWNFGWIKLDPSTYYISEAPIVFDLVWLAGANALFVGVSYLMVLLPVRWIARLDPIKSIKFS